MPCTHALMLYLNTTAAVKLTGTPSDAFTAAVQTLVLWQLAWQRWRPLSTRSGTPWTGWLTSEHALCCDIGRQSSQALTATHRALQSDKHNSRAGSPVVCSMLPTVLG